MSILAKLNKQEQDLPDLIAPMRISIQDFQEYINVLKEAEKPFKLIDARTYYRGRKVIIDPKLDN